MLTDAHTPAANSGKRKKPGQDAARFKTDEDTGKMVIDDSDDDGDAAAGGEDVEGNAYREALTSADGFTRGPNGKIKFNKDTKKRRRENEEADEDVEMADADGQQKGGKKNKRKTDPKFGHEFKAKVGASHSFTPLMPLTVRFPYRKQVETSKKEAWIPSHTCPSRRRPRSRTGEPGSASLANAESCTIALYLYAAHSHRLLALLPARSVLWENCNFGFNTAARTTTTV